MPSPSTPSSPPSGTVTFLFTDIQGSTKRWEQSPEAMSAALALHDGIMRQAIEQHGGYVFKTMGDAFCAAFPTAPQALQAALEAQRTLRSLDWSAINQDPILVRMALHTGSAEMRDNDYFGLPLNRVARLLSTGHGGQILLSLATQQLVRDHLPQGTDLRDLGAGGLRDLVRTEHVFQLVAQDLPADFPPLKALDTRYIEPASPDDAGLPIKNPYKGLRAFQEQDAADFFGREALVARLISRMGEAGPLARFLAVVGPSGSGKSSVVKAGLLPALRRGEVAGSERWIVLQMLPGGHPLEELDALLLGVTAVTNPPATLLELLQSDEPGERGLIRAARRVLPEDESVELLLLIDQFEEVFTLIEDEAARAHFLGILCAAVIEPRSRVRVIITLRADFYDRPLLYPDPGEMVRQRTEVVLPLSAEELERAIVRPAARAGVDLEAELVATIVKDVGEQPGALPLLQYALTELFDKRAGRILTLETYRDTGGVLGALSRRAEEIFSGLSTDEQALARQLFLRLVTLGEGNEDTRRRVRLVELGSISAEPGQIEKLVDEFGRHRLLTYDRDPLTGGRTVEVAHEALIRTWPRLHEWLDVSRVNLRIHRQLLAAATEWEASGRDASFLASGARLSQFETLASDIYSPRGVALNEEERAYLAASLEEREQHERAAQERQERELRLARQSAAAQKAAANRLRVLVAALGIFLVVAAVLVVFALSRQAEADTQRVESQHSAATAVVSEKQAENNLALSDGQRLAAEANLLILESGNSEQAALLSIRSLRNQYTPQGDEALEGAAALDYPLRIFSGNTNPISSVAFSPDSKYVATADSSVDMHVWDVQTGANVHVLSALLGVHKALYSPDGKYLLAVQNDTTAVLWDAHTWTEAAPFSGALSMVHAAFSPDSKYLVTSDRDYHAELWDVDSRMLLKVLGGHFAPINSLDFSPDGKYILTASEDQTARIWDVSTGHVVHILSGHALGVADAVFSPTGDRVLTSSSDRTVRLWDAQTGQELRRLGDEASSPFTVRFTPDGKGVLIVSARQMGIWDIASNKEIRSLNANTGFVQDAAFSPDGKYLVTGGDDKVAQLWDAQKDTGLPQYTADDIGLADVAYSPDGRYVATAGLDKTAKVWDASTGAQVHQLPAFDGLVTSVAFSHNGHMIAAGSADSTVKLFDAVSGTQLKKLGGYGGSINSVAFSPDDKLLVTTNGDGTIRLWETDTEGQPTEFTVPSYPNQAVFSPDGKYLLVGGDKDAYLLHADTGFVIRQFSGHTDLVYSVAFSPDGKYVLTGSWDNTARLWDVQTGEEIRRFVGHTQGLRRVAFSADGKYIATGSTDRTARIWDVATGKELRRFSGHTSLVNGVAFSPDGKYLVTASVRTVRIWNTDLNDTINYLCGLLLRDFTDDERAQYGITDKSPTCPK
jgi:WD40 repeat protein/class 3 adenylate cyclase